VLRTLLAMLVTAAAVLVAPVHPATATAQPFAYRGAVSLPATGALFGAFVKLDPHNGLNRRTAQTNFEALAGRQMAIDRQYYFWNDNWPTTDDVWSAGQGRTLYLSWSAHPNDLSGCRKWADIAAGLYDADIHSQAAKVIAFPYPIFFAFHHEPTTGNNNDSCGTPPDFIAAWRHIHDLWVADGVTNVTWSWTMTAWSFLQGNAGSFYPGDNFVDIIAADGYNWYGCTFHPGPWREPKEVFQQFHDFGVAHLKPMVIAEYGVGEDPANPGRKGQWFTNLADLLKTWTDIKGISQFNVGNGSCDRYIDTSPTSLDAFQKNGADPYFKPPVTTTGVTVADFSFSPTTIKPGRGTGAQWTFNGPSNHTATDSSGMKLFDSGSRAPGSAYSFYFIAAGNYKYKCTIYPTMTGLVKVPVLADPPSGGVTTTFTITWAANHPPTSYVFDVQIQRPGSSLWVDWQLGVTTVSATFVPDSGTGTYSFHARYRKLSTNKSSQYSDPASIVVS